MLWSAPPPVLFGHVEGNGSAAADEVWPLDGGEVHCSRSNFDGTLCRDVFAAPNVVGEDSTLFNVDMNAVIAIEDTACLFVDSFTGR